MEEEHRMIYITGDRHGDFESIEEFCREHHTRDDDVLILLGDVGLNFCLDGTDRKEKRRLSKLPITLFCIHGNHEERPYNVKGYRLVERFGGLVYRQRRYPNILFARDGEDYAIGGRRFLVLGGAYSTDKHMRLREGWPWFASEQPSPDDRARARETLERCGNSFDIVLSHTCPRKYLGERLRHDYMDGHEIDYTTEDWLEGIENQITYSHWYFGHFHKDMAISDRMDALYRSFVSLKD